jgi:hypothetical protein
MALGQGIGSWESGRNGIDALVLEPLTVRDSFCV